MKTVLLASLIVELSIIRLVAQVPASTGNSTNTTDAAPKDETEVGAKLIPLEPESDSVWTNSAEMVLVNAGDFWVGKYEVTQKAYEAVAGNNPSAFPGEDRPVDSVSWKDAMAFCKKLTEMDNGKKLLPEGYAYNLPTEKQWESLASGASLENAVTSDKGSRSSPEPVGSKGATSAGVYDIRGNLWEWMRDGFNPDYNYRVLRGAAWNTDFEVNLRTNFRFYSNGPDDRKNNYGFRVVLVKDSRPPGATGTSAY